MPQPTSPSKLIKLSLRFALGLGAIVAIYLLLVRRGYLFPMSLWSEVICEKCAAQPAYHQPPIGAETLFSQQPIEKLLTNSQDLSKISVLVEKSQYRLTIYQDKRAIKTYPIVLGDSPKGDKYREGDRRTPEGIFYIKDLYPHAEWSKFLFLDYPNATSWRKHFAEKQSGRLAWDRSIGSEVGIHGVPNNNSKLIDDRINWTWGCVSLKNKDIDEIYRTVRVGTVVEIVP